MGSPRRPLLSVYTPVYNEEPTVRHCWKTVRDVMASLGDRYDWEHVFADNCSEDRTLEILREIAAEDPHVRVLAYSKNFGAEKSSFTALRHVSGDAAVGITADLQEPPALIPQFVELWEKGNEVVYGVYANPHEAFPMRFLRATYYFLADRISPESLPRGFTGFALVDRKVIDEVVKVDDYAPYIRGIIANVGFRQIAVPFERQLRQAGRSKHGILFLIDFAINGMITHSLAPIRLATLSGLGLSAFSILLAVAYVIVKLYDWSFQAPGATTTIAFVLFFSGVQLLFLGMIGEYVGAIHAQVRRKPFVIIRERIGFDRPALERIDDEGGHVEERRVS